MDVFLVLGQGIHLKYRESRTVKGRGSVLGADVGARYILIIPLAFSFFSSECPGCPLPSLEHQLACLGAPLSFSACPLSRQYPVLNTVRELQQGLRQSRGHPPAVLPNADVVARTCEALLQKLTWASAELGSSTSRETSIQLCSLIRACAEALRSPKQLQH